MGVIPPFMSWVIKHDTTLVSMCLCDPFSRTAGARGRTYKHQNLPNRKCRHSPVMILIDLYCFCRKRISSGAEHHGEAQNAVTSCFPRQTGSASILQSVIDWFVPFSQEGGFSGCGTQWWSSKWRHFLFCLPNRKCQCFPTCDRLIRTILTGRGFLGMTNKIKKFEMWKWRKPQINQLQAEKCWHFLFGERKQEVTPF